MVVDISRSLSGPENVNLQKLPELYLKNVNKKIKSRNESNNIVKSFFGITDTNLIEDTKMNYSQDTDGMNSIPK